MSSQFSSPPHPQSSSAPSAERVDVACDSWDQFEQSFRQKLESHQVFVPSINPPPPGTQLEFRFSVPDGSSISIAAHVISSVPPSRHASLIPSIPVPSMPPTPSGRPGMFVAFGAPPHAQEPAPHAQEPGASEEAGDDTIDAALELIAVQRYEDAIRVLVRVLNAEPDAVEARLLLNIAGARHAKLQGESGIAADCYRVVLELQPAHPEARRELPLLAPARPAPVPLARVNLVERRVVRRKD